MLEQWNIVLKFCSNTYEADNHSVSLIKSNFYWVTKRIIVLTGTKAYGTTACYAHILGLKTNGDQYINFFGLIAPI